MLTSGGDRRRRLKELFANYSPSEMELWEPDDPRFTRPLNYVLKNQRRLQLALDRGLAALPAPPLTILDLGPYPGSLLRLLRRLFAVEEARLLGAGLMISEEFVASLKRETEAEVFAVNLDPANLRLKDSHPDRVPLEPGSVDFVFALEIIEHLHGPLHLLEEAFRLLRPGGHLLITTVNVSRIGNVLKLIAGRSNFDRVTPLDYSREDDQWGPHVREYTIQELAGALARIGFDVVQREHFRVGDTRYSVKSTAERFGDFFKLPFLLVPHFRDGLLIMGRKPLKG